jgi:DhnA family fructose-bisphosphate aldolase class Ia
MSDFGKSVRLNRLLRASKQKALVVAFDHAMVLGPIAGTINPFEQIQKFSDAGVNGVLMNFGMLHHANGILCHPAPALILRLDWTTAWTAVESGGKLRTELLARPEDALRNGADAVLTYLFIGTGDLEFEAREIARNAEVARECERLGIPLIVETLARGKDVSNPTSPEWIKLHNRIAAEIGADIIKTEYTGDVATMREVVAVCPIPILVLGGARHSDDAATEAARGVAQSGAAGVFFGRNVFQAPDVADFLKRTRRILDASSDKAERTSSRGEK